MNNIDIKELKTRIENTKQRIKELQELKEELKNKYLKAMCPAGYKSMTSYADYDCIHGSREELRLEDLDKKLAEIDVEIEKKTVLLELDEKLLKNKEDEVNINEYLEQLTSNIDKVKFLWKVCGMKQQEIADKIFLSLRQVQNIEAKIRKEAIS